MIDLDLFGKPVADFPSLRQKKANAGKPQGYAAPPGTGPRGETCGSCEFAVRRQFNVKHFWKCHMYLKIYGVRWTNSYGTDIRLKSPACKHWQIHKLSPFKTAIA